MGHLTRMANKLISLSPNNEAIKGALEGQPGWNEWHQNVLQKRNSLENVFQWSCG
jgi:serine/threonine-protein phosphatase 6 regulatory subunit 3